MASPNMGNAQLVVGAVNAHVEQQSAETVQVVQQLRDAVEAKQPPSKVNTLLKTLREKSVDVVAEVVKAAVLKPIGV